MAWLLQRSYKPPKGSVPRMGSKPLLSASLCRSFSGPYKHVASPCRSLILSRFFDQRKLRVCHSDF